MGTATFFTAARMQQIEDSTVVSGLVDVNGHLILKRRDDQTIDAGNVVGPQGPRGYNNLFDFWQLGSPTSTPPSGSVSANTATLVNAATLYFHVIPEGGSSFEGLFRLLKAGSMISVQSAGTPANWVQFTTTSGFSFTGNVASINVMLKDQAGAAVSSERVAVMFTQPTAITATGQMGKGTSAQRDGFYGVPTTDAQRVALANSVPIWFNTQKGWKESYYAPSSLPGLTVRGLKSIAPAGWYPVEGNGPKILLSSNGTIQNMTTGSVFTNWAAPGTAFSWRMGGSDYIEFSSGVVKPKIWGRYRCSISLSIQTGAGTGAFTMVHYTDTGVQAYTYSMSTVTLNTSLQDRFDLSVENVEMLPNESLRAYASNLGGANLGVLGANLASASYFLEYIGPALVSE